MILQYNILSPQELPKLLQDLGTADADLPWNKSKNRFPNIKPCKSSNWRLALQTRYISLLFFFQRISLHQLSVDGTAAHVFSFSLDDV